MREINFRVWDKAEHRMFDVEQLVFDPNGELVSIYSYGPDFSNDLDALMGEKPDLNEAALMEYTGLHDKNGREIYEGDIVHAYDQEPDRYEPDYRGSEATGIVEFHGSMFMLDDDIILNYPPILEVIGNIYENPELLGDRQ